MADGRKPADDAKRPGGAGLPAKLAQKVSGNLVSDRGKGRAPAVVDGASAALSPPTAKKALPAAKKTLPAAQGAATRGAKLPAKNAVIPQKRRKARPSRVVRSLTADTAPLEDREEIRDPLWQAIAAFARIASLMFVVLTISIWGQVLGFFGGPLVLNWYAPSGPWLLALAAAVVFPVTAVGVWLLARWGAVIFLTALALLALILFRADGALVPYGLPALVLVVLLGVVLGGLIALRAFRSEEYEGV